jgi:peroxiredoxin Q/BCP
MNILQEGEKAPTFKGVDQNGNAIELSDFKGKKLVLYFYPKDDTPGCTAQACNLRDNYSVLLQQGFAVVGVSADSIKRHKKFETKFNLPFPLIADETHAIAEKYGVWQLKKFMGHESMGIVRTSFLIDEEGNILHIIHKPDTKNHTEEILKLFDK